MPMTEDLTAFFDVDEHATAATYNAATVNGIFEDQFVAVGGIESSRPTFTCDEADVAGIVHGDSITINSIIYTVAGHQPDGTGIMFLILKEP